MEIYKHNIKITDDLGLCCPDCGNGNLHQQEITVFARNEDSNKTKTIRVNNYSGDLTTQEVLSEISNNPSSRRQGLIIVFECEHCSENKILRIYQHKGSTYMDFE